MQTEPKPLNIAEIRRKLENKSGREYWRSLEELSETSEFDQWVADEFPNRSSLLQIDRRRLLKFMGASMALAGLAGCRSPFWPNHKMVPYVVAPEEVVQGKPLFFSGGVPRSGYVMPVLVETHSGRPTRIDGNELDPGGQGTCDVLTQASILNLYDPDRSRNVRKDNTAVTWDMFLKEARPEVQRLAAQKGKGLAFLFQSTNSPSMQMAVNEFLAKMPDARVVFWEPVNFESGFEGTKRVLGQAADADYDLSKARVILTLDADVLGFGPGQLKNARGWAQGRRAVDGDPQVMNRMYSLEVTPTVTGAAADHKLPVSSWELEQMTAYVAQALGVSVTMESTLDAGAVKWIDAVVADLKDKGSEAVVVAGAFASANVHAMAAAINLALGSAAVAYRPTHVIQAGEQGMRLAELVDRMKAGEIECLMMLGGDPVNEVPKDLGFAEALAKVKFAAHMGSYVKGTSKKVRWHLPESHPFETWNDGFTVEGHRVVAQPMIAPLFDTKSPLEAFIAVQGASTDAMTLVQKAWQTGTGVTGDVAKAWRQALHDGILVAKAPVALTATAVAGTVATAKTNTVGEIEVALRPDPTIYDGRFVNNGWMQEQPKPLSTLTWDNSVHVSPTLAEEMGLGIGDLVDVTVGDTSVRGPIWIMPGQPTRTITVFYGYGSDLDGMMAKGTGFDAFPLITRESLTGAVPGNLNKAGGRIQMGHTQHHHTMEGRDIVRVVTLDAMLHGGTDEHGNDHGHEGEGHGDEGHAKEPKYTVDGKPWPKTAHDEQTMYQHNDFEYDGPQWGMTIDLNLCMGCHACVTACTAENNIAVVGKQEVIMHREMHWIRIDRYYGPKDASTLFGGKTDLTNPSVSFMPVACMHCEQAPCEPVCPVAATVHSHEGLNSMIYNRCVGTRYCSNNCPYKVRRFNFFNYNDRKFTEFPAYKDLRVRLLVNNPDVTVRGRGVMEKCTFCVQRINDARQTAKVEFSKGRREKPDPMDGEVRTACQVACPTGAITFGNIADPNSRVSAAKKSARNYSLLKELNTRNRLTYLHQVKNPNRALENA